MCSFSQDFHRISMSSVHKLWVPVVFSRAIFASMKTSFSGTFCCEHDFSHVFPAISTNTYLEKRVHDENYECYRLVEMCIEKRNHEYPKRGPRCFCLCVGALHFQFQSEKTKIPCEREDKTLRDSFFLHEYTHHSHDEQTHGHTHTRRHKETETKKTHTRLFSC